MLGSYCARRSGSGAHPGRFPLRADARLPMALPAVYMAGGGAPPVCVGTVEGGKDAPAAPRVWQYISLPRGAGATGGAYLENRILRGERPCRAHGRSPGDRTKRTISMVSSDVRNCQMSKANPYDSFPSRKRLFTFEWIRSALQPAGRAHPRPNILWTESSILAQDERWRRA